MISTAISRATSASALALAALAVLMVSSFSPAHADLYVLESTTAAISPGSHLASEEAITIPAGGFIRAVLSSGKTQTIRGPFSGSVGDLDRGQAHNVGVLNWIRTILETGGSREITPGATRGIRREPALNLAFSWSSVPATGDAIVCIEKGKAIELKRAPSSHPDRVSIIDTADGARGEAQWQAGSDVAAWPANLTPRADGSYYLLAPDRPRRQLTLRVLDKVPADDDVLVVLQKLGCKLQFDAWVRERLAANGR